MTKEEVASIVKYCNDNDVTCLTGGLPKYNYFDNTFQYPLLKLPTRSK